MLKLRVPTAGNQTLVGVSLFVFGLVLAWEVGGKIVANDERSLIFAALGFAGCAIAVTILRSWRAGFYLFFIWLLFEDLIRKYMGNNLALFFGKDILLALVYVALFREIRRGREKTFRPPFLLFWSFFFWLGVLQIFNQNSPSLLYGLLGFKLYFYYVPLLFVGYALIRSDEDLRKFLLVNAVIAGVIGGLGIAQAIVGNGFLNPSKLAPELEDLGNLTKASPISNQAFSLPDSVFVSSGRFGQYLIVAFILAMGTAAYLLFSTQRNRKLIFAAVGLVGCATLLSGSRTALVGVVFSALVLWAAFLWGTPWRQAFRIVKAIRRSAIVAALALTALILAYPEKAASRLAFYAETLSPESSAYEGSQRAWRYPISNFLDAFNRPNWEIGNGIGTASLGGQYVAKVLGAQQYQISVEEGYGQLIIEMGIIAPILWIIWTAALVYYSWGVVRRLRETRLFPIAFAILWYAFLLLYPLTYVGLAQYENYIANAFLWLLTGILYRLPEILITPPTPIMPPRHQPRSGAESTK